MSQNTKKILIGTGIAVAGLAAIGAASYAITKTLVSFALDREMPKNMKKMEGVKQNLLGVEEKETLDKLAKAAEALENRDHETIEIFAEDGERLVAHWFPCEHAERTVVAMHGWRSVWNHDFGVIADFWHDNRCNILCAEQRGQNNSGGDYMTFGLKERYDCRKWIEWVNEHTEEQLPIYLAGVSMGASTVLMASGLELPSNVRGIVADCGFTSPDAIWKKVVEKNFHLPYAGMRSAVADDMCKKKIHEGTKSYSTINAMKKSNIPVLFIHGTDDDFVPIRMTYENYKACVAPKRLFVVPGAGHGMSYLVDKDGYENAVKNFWNEFD